MNQETKNENPQWEELNPGIWKPELKGDSIEGLYIAKKENVGNYQSEAYILETRGEHFLVFSNTVLKDRMQIAHIGDMIKIEYCGVEKNKKGQDTKIFKVYKAE